MDDLKEVKLAWANGEQVQGSYDSTEWKDWHSQSRLELEQYSYWRVKPKYKTVKQWERKYYDPMDGKVYTSALSKASDTWEMGYIWITEQNLVEYKVPYDER